MRTPVCSTGTQLDPTNVGMKPLSERDENVPEELFAVL